MSLQTRLSALIAAIGADIKSLDAGKADASKGVTNGDAHDHSGGNGGQIAYSSLSGLPTLGTAAPLNVAPSGNAAAGDVVKGNDTRLSDSREWTAATVDQAEAEAGTATTRRAWTAQRVRQAIAAWWQTVPSATESTAGRLQLATAAEVQAGTDTSRAITPAGLSSRTATEARTGIVELATAAEAQAFAADKVIDGAKLAAALQGNNQLLATSGYQKLPGGLIIQWGIVSSIATGGTKTFTYPVAFPTGPFCAFATSGSGTRANCIPFGTIPGSVSCTVTNGGSAVSTAYVLVIGR